MVAALGARPTRVFLIVLACAVAAAMRPTGMRAQEPGMRWDGVIEHLSQASGTGWPNPSGAARLSRHPLSSDGRYVVFAADVPNDPSPATSQMFRRDRLTNETQMIGGFQVPQPPVISADGNSVAFQSCEPWLRNDSAPICDIYVIDFRTWAFVDASTALDGTLSDAESAEPMLSRDGRFLAFRTSSTTLLPPGAAPGQVVLRDRDADGNGIFDEPGGVTLETVSISSAGEPGNAASSSAEVSADGRIVAFRSAASNLVAGDTNNASDVFFRDRQSETRRINVNPWTGQEATPTVDSPAISMSGESGELIAFAADDAYLGDSPAGGSGDTNNALDVLVYDRIAGTLQRIDVGAYGETGNNHTYWPTFSGDGRYLSLVSFATNIDGPVTPGRSHAYVYDRFVGVTTRVSLNLDGEEPDGSTTSAAISADGSFVAFLSPATNLAATAIAGLDSVFGAAHFSIEPGELTMPSAGGEVTATITAQQYALWNHDFSNSPWVHFTTQPWGPGNGSVTFAADRNPDPVSRSHTFRFNSRSLVVTQEAGLSLTDFSPASGPGTGGTVVTLTGTGFEPETKAWVEGVAVTFGFIDSTTARIMMPPNQPGDVHIVLCTPDFYYCAWSDATFHYLDTTPPDVFGWAEGDLSPSGWYRGDVMIHWSIFDAETPFTTDAGCNFTILTTDTAGTTFTCTATSEGGTASSSVTVKRDARPPLAVVSSPQRTLYRLNQAVNAVYSCADSSPGSGIESCVAPVPNQTPFDTSVPGFHTFDLTATDRAGHVSSASRSYAVSTGMCTARPENLVAWWPGDYDYRDVIGGHDGVLVNQSYFGEFAGGISRGSMSFTAYDGRYVKVDDTPALRMQGALTLSAWVFTRSLRQEMIAGREGEYLLGRGPDGRIRYSIANTDPGWGWVNTNVSIDTDVFTHIVFTYDGTTIKLYKNGQLAYSRAGSGDIGDAVPEMNDFVIGARQDPADRQEYSGLVDNVEVVSRALTAEEIERAFLSADVGYCPDPSTLTFVPVPQRGTYGQPTIRLSALLQRAGVPEPNTWVAFSFRGTPIGSNTTDSTGIATIEASMPAGLTAGTYLNAATATVSANAVLTASSAVSDFVLDKATPVITWATPASIVYGTGLTLQQLNATANVSGFLNYTPAYGTVLGAGSQTLSTTFTPSNSNYTTTTANVVLQVTKATPTITVTGGAFTYDGAAHAATASVQGVGGATLGPVTFTYNGSAAVPIDAGSYTVVASYAGDANYNAASQTATLTIARATPTVNVTGGGFTYDGAAHAATASVTGVGGASLGPVTFTYNDVADVPVNAGTYAVVASYAGDANYNAGSGTATLTIAKATPTVAAVGGMFTYDGTPHAASGTVTGIGEETLGPLTFTYNGSSAVPTDAGTYAVVASYAGNANYTAASADATLTIGKATPSVTVNGGSFTYDGAAHPATGTVTGVDGASIGSLTFAYNDLSEAPVNAGEYAVVGTFAGDANYESATGTATITIGRAVAVVDWNAPAAIVYGTPLGAAQLNATANTEGTFAYSPAAGTVLAAGTGHVLMVTFAPDSANYIGASSSTTVNVLRAPLTVRADDATKRYGAPLPEFIASGSGFVNGDSFASLTGTVSFTTAANAASPVGTYAVTPSGVTSANYDVTFANGTLTVVRGAVTVVTSTTPEPSGFNQPMTFSVTVSSAAPAVGTPGGTVSFFDGSTRLGTVTLSGGTATLSTAGLDPGTRTIEARYDGDGAFESGTGSSSHVIADSASTPTLTLTSSRNPANVGQSVTLTANVSMSSGAVTGTVQFYDGATLLGQSAISAGRATWTTASLPAGSHAITARYVGNGSIPPAYSSVFVQAFGASGWKDRTTTLTLSSTPNPATLGTTVAFIASVTGSTSSMPTGRVLILVNGSVVGDPNGMPLTPSSGSTAAVSWSDSALAHGRHVVTATYLGDPNYKGSTSTVSEVIN